MPVTSETTSAHRWGPFAIGGILACNVFISHNTAPRPSAIGSLSASLLTLPALAVIVVPCLPPPEELPPAAVQLVVTAAMRVISASAFALLLYRATVPPGHAWRLDALSWLLSLRLWQPLATISFASYLVHLPLMMELCFNAREGGLRSLIGLRPPEWVGAPQDVAGLGTAEDAVEWLAFMTKLGVVTAALSPIVAYPLHVLVEKPLVGLVKWGGERESARRIPSRTKVE